MDEKIENNKLNKEFKVVFGTNCIMLLITVLLYFLHETNNTEVLEVIVALYMLIAFSISLIFLIVTTILGIVNYRKKKNKKIRKKIIIMLSSIIIFYIIIGLGAIILSGNSNKNELDNSIETDKKVILTERQKSILAQEDLPTDYDELTYTQKKAIVAIEEMLSAIETKYGMSFEYLSYTGVGYIGTESLTAYPSGYSEYYSFTVTRKLKDGEYVYEDGFRLMVTEPVFNEFVLNYCNKELGEGNVKVYSVVTNIKTNQFPISLQNVAHKVDGDNWIFIDGEFVSKEKYNEFLVNYRAWVDENEISSSNRIILLYGGILKKLTEFNYTDYFSSFYCISDEFVTTWL